jgi:sigma-B regulation protein RsbU (phosphoserine phosphatase)
MLLNEIVEMSALRASEAPAPRRLPSLLTGSGRIFSSAAEVDLRELVGHNTTVEASARIEDVSRTLADSAVDFLAVTEDGTLVGMCSRRELGILLGSRYGFSLWARHPIREHLGKNEIRISLGDPIGAVLAIVFARGDDTFYDDVLLVDAEGQFIGLISTQTLFKVQNALLRGNIIELQTKEREIQTKNTQMEADLRMAMELQQALLPKEYPLFPPTATVETAHLRFAHLYQPASFIGGDFFHIVRISDHEAGVFIFDVMGHGVRSALITAMLRALIEAEAANLADPGLVLTHLNRELTAILKQTGTVLFVTALYCVFDSERRRMRHARAGHPPPMHVGRGAGEIQFVSGVEDSAGPALGLFAKSNFGTTSCQLSRGDLVLLFTDGIIEADNAAGDEFGVDGLRATAQANLQTPGGDLLGLLLASARAFTGASEFADDVCLASVELF